MELKFTLCKGCNTKIFYGFNKPKNKRCKTCYSIHRREQILKDKYNISIEDYENLLIDQLGVCAICHKREATINTTGNAIRLAVDHCHKTGKIRGLLCSNCNTALGKFKDDISLLAKAIAYLTSHQE
jgi:hypothetical protein